MCRDDKMSGIFFKILQQRKQKKWGYKAMWQISINRALGNDSGI